jgi:holo-[acyl-carrier protein] synthase
MGIRIGLDLTEVARVSRLLERWGERFLMRVFAPGELNRRRRQPQAFAEHVAGRFAAKEAAMKAIGTGWRRGVRWQDFEVTNLRSGRPTLVLHGVAAAIAGNLGVKAISLSLTHTASQGMAVVILEA